MLPSFVWLSSPTCREDLPILEDSMILSSKYSMKPSDKHADATCMIGAEAVSRMLKSQRWGLRSPDSSYHASGDRDGPGRYLFQHSDARDKRF